MQGRWENLNSATTSAVICGSARHFIATTFVAHSVGHRRPYRLMAPRRTRGAPASSANTETEGTQTDDLCAPRVVSCSSTQTDRRPQTVHGVTQTDWLELDGVAGTGAFSDNEGGLVISPRIRLGRLEARVKGLEVLERSSAKTVWAAAERANLLAELQENKSRELEVLLQTLGNEINDLKKQDSLHEETVAFFDERTERALKDMNRLIAGAQGVNLLAESHEKKIRALEASGQELGDQINDLKKQNAMHEEMVTSIDERTRKAVEDINRLSKTLQAENCAIEQRIQDVTSSHAGSLDLQATNLSILEHRTRTLQEQLEFQILQAQAAGRRANSPFRQGALTATELQEALLKKFAPQ